MPRLARLDAPGVLHHVIIRGIERRKIFKDNKDRDNLLDRLENLLPVTKTTCYAWSLLSNHAHFLFRTGTAPLSTVMRRLLTGYALSFNRRHKRHGQLFQNRYKSIICQEDAYLKELVRYIHLNPVRAKIVSDISELNRYAYCGHSVLMDKKKRPWQDSGYVLSYFGKSLREARKRYLQYIEAGVEQGRRPDLTGGGLLRSQGGWAGVKLLRKSGDYQKGDERILGDGEFVTQVLAKAEEQFQHKYRIKAEGYDLDKVINRVAKITQLSRKEILDAERDRKRVQARSILCFWATDQLGITQSQLAETLNLTQSAISHAARRGKTLVNNNCFSMFEE